MKTFSDQDYQIDAKYADHEGPPAAPDCRGRTAGGLGGAAPASLDSYGQSSITLLLYFSGPGFTSLLARGMGFEEIDYLQNYRRIP